MAWKCNCGAINSGIQLPIGSLDNYKVRCAADTTKFKNYNVPVWQTQPQTKPDNEHYPVTFNDLDVSTIDYFKIRISAMDEVINRFGYVDMNTPRWLCSCGEINDNPICSKVFWIETEAEHKRVKWLEDKDKEQKMGMEDLFKKYRNDERVLISAMSSEDFRIHEEELAKIAFEVKARLIEVVEYKKEQNQALKAGQKEWIVNRTDAEDQLVSDAISSVASRKKRLNKAEKLEQQLKEMNIYTDEEIRVIMGNIHRNATEKQMNLTTFVSKKVEEAKQEIKEEKQEAEVKEQKPIDLDLF